MCRRSMHAWDGIFHSNCSWDEDDDEDDEHAVDEMRLLPLVIWLLKGVQKLWRERLREGGRGRCGD